jgi:glutamate formiminotransferase
VPNFSEGRDESVVQSIASSIGSVPGAAVLDTHLDADHNRSVITFAGAPEAVIEGAVQGVARAAALIDLNRHTGIHPRIGAADVVPFVPLQGLSLESAARYAHLAGEKIWRRCGVPVYFYETAARRTDRVNLVEIRRGQFETLREKVRLDPTARPDVGGPLLHPSAGAAVVGARGFLIAFNVNLATADVAPARRIAKRIRYSSGGFVGVKALGVLLASRHMAQVTMNLTDFALTPLDELMETIESEAAALGVAVSGCEIVGLLPRAAYELAPRFFERAANFSRSVILEERLAAIQSNLYRPA